MDLSYRESLAPNRPAGKVHLIEAGDTYVHDQNFGPVDPNVTAYAHGGWMRIKRETRQYFYADHYAPTLIAVDPWSFGYFIAANGGTADTPTLATIDGTKTTVYTINSDTIDLGDYVPARYSHSFTIGRQYPAIEFKTWLDNKGRPVRQRIVYRETDGEKKSTTTDYESWKAGPAPRPPSGEIAYTVS